MLSNLTESQRVLAEPAKAACTSDRETPNCLAIRDGGTPALKAARIAFNLPCGKATVAISVCDFRSLFSGTESFRRSRS